MAVRPPNFFDHGFWKCRDNASDSQNQGNEDVQKKKEDLFRRASEMDEEAILILKQNYLKNGEDLLEMLGYLNQAALDERTFLTVEGFLQGLCYTVLLKEGLKAVIRKDPGMALRIFEAIGEWEWSYWEIEDILQLVDNAYGYLLSEVDKEADKEHLGNFISKLIEFCKSKRFTIPELKNFCPPRKRGRLKADSISDNE